MWSANYFCHTARSDIDERLSRYERRIGCEKYSRSKLRTRDGMVGGKLVFAEGAKVLFIYAQHNALQIELSFKLRSSEMSKTVLILP